MVLRFLAVFSSGLLLCLVVLIVASLLAGTGLSNTHPRGELYDWEKSQALTIQGSSICLMFAVIGYLLSRLTRRSIIELALTIANPINIALAVILFVSLALPVPRGYYPLSRYDLARQIGVMSLASFVGCLAGLLCTKLKSRILR